MVMGVEGEMNKTVEDGSDLGESDDEEIEETDAEAIKVVEQKVGGFNCPLFILSKAEERRIHKPWKRGVIVKLLGRKIGYKALETRLKQMWVKKGVINIIDLSNDYNLVTFSHDQDHTTAMLNGLWFIYDHYLTVKPWSPNFHPQSDTIKSVAVWVRISELPIEYYDCRILHHIGNKIGKTVKVDKNTVLHARGKYARICVEIDLTKTLVAMFMINNRSYKVEYEGLHLLCTSCGKFGHYKEGCQEGATNILTVQGKKGLEQVVGNQSGDSGSKGQGGDKFLGNESKGPWVVVQKPRRTRKGKEKDSNGWVGGVKKVPATTNEAVNNDPVKVINLPKIGGSRFNLLNSEINELMEEDSHLNGNELNGSLSVENVNDINSNQKKELERNISKNGNINESDIAGQSKIQEELVVSLTNTEEKKNSNNSKPTGLATRGGIVIKEKSSGISKKGIQDMFGTAKTWTTNLEKQAELYNLQIKKDLTLKTKECFQYFNTDNSLEDGKSTTLPQGNDEETEENSIDNENDLTMEVVE
ncbi:uncharacterized protein LOC131597426 [Vicia villosa]|uniref:uncharacterized protein LOC131597426 n=1 Tax=Vicia villosa TaxID=3911 RepID=UPI00273A8867|nr:uncharacterized protein LOC131597426 [Vicia villosa]